MNKNTLLRAGIATIAIIALAFFIFRNFTTSTDLNIQDNNGNGVWDDVEWTAGVKLESNTVKKLQ